MLTTYNINNNYHYFCCATSFDHSSYNPLKQSYIAVIVYTSLHIVSIPSGTLIHSQWYSGTGWKVGIQSVGRVGLKGHPVSVHLFPVVQWDGMDSRDTQCG